MGEGFAGAEHRLQQRPQRRPVGRPIGPDLQWRGGRRQWRGGLGWASGERNRSLDCLPCKADGALPWLRKFPIGRRPVGGALAPVADHGLGSWGRSRSGVWGFRRGLSGAWQARKGDRVGEKRCSGLDLLGCDPSSGYVARGVKWRQLKLAYRSLQIRDDLRAKPSSSLWVSRILGAPPLGAPARVIPGRTLLEGGDGLAPGPPPSTTNYASFQAVVACRSAYSRTSCRSAYRAAFRNAFRTASLTASRTASHIA